MNNATDSMASTDEISFSYVISKIWKRRGLVAACGLIGLLVGGLSAMIVGLRTNGFVEYHVSLQGIEKLEYPNGTAFSPQDLLIPDILNEIASDNGLENPQELRRALTIELGNPTTLGIKEKYKQQLAKGRLSATEIDDINARYSEELRRATQNGLKISINHIDLGIDDKLAENILIQLPERWSKVFTRRFRVLDDRALQGISVVKPQPLTTPLGVIEADRMFDNIRDGLETLSSDNRLSALQASENVTAEDLLRTLDDFNSVYLSIILATKLNEGSFLTKVYLNNFRLKIAEIDNKLAGLRQTILDIRSTMEGQANNSATSLGGRSDALQVDGGALADIITLANQASLSAYLQTIFEAQRTLIDERARIQTRIDRIEQVGKVDVAFANAAQTKLDYIVETYNELLANARAQTKSEFKSFYRPIVMPSTVRDSWTLQGLLAFVACLFLGMLTGLVAALAWRD